MAQNEGRTAGARRSRPSAISVRGYFTSTHLPFSILTIIARAVVESVVVRVALITNTPCVADDFLVALERIAQRGAELLRSRLAPSSAPRGIALREQQIGVPGMAAERRARILAEFRFVLGDVLGGGSS